MSLTQKSDKKRRFAKVSTKKVWQLIYCQTFFLYILPIQPFAFFLSLSTVRMTRDVISSAPVAYPVGLVLCSIFHSIYLVYFIFWDISWYESALKIRHFNGCNLLISFYYKYKSSEKSWVGMVFAPLFGKCNIISSLIIIPTVAPKSLWVDSWGFSFPAQARKFIRAILRILTWIFRPIIYRNLI